MLTYKIIENLEVVGYSGADFVGCVDTKKSTSGYVFTLANGAISWNKQSLTAASTMQAKFVTCYEAVGQAVWLKGFIPRLRVVDNISKPLRLCCDNKVTVFYANNNKSSGTVKHIEIKYFVMKDRIKIILLS